MFALRLFAFMRNPVNSTNLPGSKGEVRVGQAFFAVAGIQRILFRTS